MYYAPGRDHKRQRSPRLIRGDGDAFTLVARELGQVLVMGGAAIDDPVVVDGPFVMNDHSQIADALQRYRSGAMGSLAPLTR